MLRARNPWRQRCTMRALAGLAILGLTQFVWHGGQADAQVFQERNRFSIEADGFEMRGRCFMPGPIEIEHAWNLVIPGSSLFSTFGCVVKNRRGLVLRRRADVEIKTVLYIADEDGDPMADILLSEKECDDVFRCAVRTDLPSARAALERSAPSPRVAGSRDVEYVGLVGQICGQRQERKTFRRPSIRIDWCRNWGRNCGQEAANAFCREMGYTAATDYSKDPAVETTTLVLEDGRTCDGRRRHCDSFKKITCLGPEVASFREPGIRVDWCRTWGRECGREAADAFCHAVGYDRAAAITKDPAVETTTFVREAGRFCDGRSRHCDSFKNIKCERDRDATFIAVPVGNVPDEIRLGGEWHPKNHRATAPSCRYLP